MIVNKIFNWLFGACFRTLGRFLAIIIIIFLLLFIGSKFDIKMPSFLMMNVNAATLTSYDTYAQYMNGSSSCGSSGKFSYALAGPAAREWESANIGTTISGKAYAIDLAFNQTLLANTYYDITINFMSNDLRYTFTRNMLKITSGQSCQSYNGDNIAIVTFNNNATSSRNTNVLKLRIYNAVVVNYFNIHMDGANQNITSVNTFGIKSISITQVEDNSTEDIINNNNQNTEDIINNDNANTDRIEGAINEQLGNPCTNLIDFPYYNNNPFVINAPSDDYKVQTGYYFSAKANTTYKYSYGSNKTGGYIGDTVQIYVLENGQYNYYQSLTDKNGGTFTTGSTDTDYYIRLDCNQAGSTCTFYNLMISETTSNYCKYGSYVSKLDDVNSSLNDLNGSINNNDTTGSQSTANGFFNNFQSEDFGLSSIVTAPLRGINAMLTDTCIAPSATYKGQTFSLPCGSMLWSRPGGEDFKSFINVMYGGFLAYLVIRKFFLDVEDLKNPNSDKVEVDKL